MLISGEGGIGKSRLTAALLESVATEPHTRLRYFCSPQHTDSALYPIIGQMERAAGLGYDDKPQAKLDKLDAVLAQTSTSREDTTLFAEMLSLSNDGRYPALALTPEQRRQRTLEALTSQLAGLASQQPLLMIFEDVQWIDPTSLEVLGRVVDRIKTLPVLLIVTFRPEFNPPWVGQSRVASVTLNRLGEREAAAIIARLVGNKELPADVMAEIVERTDGIPLFVEEMTKAVLEAEGEGEARRTVASAPSPALAVPASLHASLMARLDRLGPAKEVAQIGAAIGREFSHALLAAVVRKPDVELTSALDRLMVAGLLFRQGVPPHATTCSSMPWYRTRPMARCCASRDARFMLASPTPSKPTSGHCREPAGTAGASLHRGRADREGRDLVGQSGSAVAGALGAGRSRRAAHACACPDRGPARHSRAASRADQAFRSRS